MRFISFFKLLDLSFVQLPLQLNFSRSLKENILKQIRNYLLYSLSYCSDHFGEQT